jgi:ATP-dependent Clp protease ATP-binding subunit ClpB
MKSNIGAARLIDGINDDGYIRPGVREEVLGMLRSSFRPEFLNRVDDIVLFKPLRMPELKKIVDLQLDSLRRRLAGRQITIDLTDKAREFIVREAYDPHYGARPLRRYLQKELETQIARALIAGTITDGQHLTVDTDGATLIIK